MKRIIYIIAAALLTAACADKSGTQQGGSDKQPSLKEQVCGEWHSTEIPTADTDIYISLTEDGKFELYQKAGDGDYRLYRGTWGLEGTLLSGKYNDGEDWAASYNVAVKESELKLVSNNDAAETSTFEKCSIPEDVKDTPHIEVKGADTF